MKYIQLQLIFLSLEILFLGGQRVNLQIKCRKFGYEMQALRSVMKCLHWNRENVTFTEAKEHCKGRRGIVVGTTMQPSISSGELVIPLVLYDLSTAVENVDQAFVVLECADGGFLATFKTKDEVALATTTDVWHFWVGLDDMQNEGIFRWHDDGTIAQNVKDIFKFQDMSRRPSSADCVSFMPSFCSHILTFCDTKAGFVCEIRAAL